MPVQAHHARHGSTLFRIAGLPAHRITRSRDASPAVMQAALLDEDHNNGGHAEREGNEMPGYLAHFRDDVDQVLTVLARPRNREALG
jgi:hypothetical protein